MLFEDYPLQFAVAVMILLTLNSVATLAVSRDDGLSPVQKFVQVLIIWTLPFLGGLAMLSLVGSYHSREEMRSMVPFPFYMVGYRESEHPNPFDNEGTEGTCGDGD